MFRYIALAWDPSDPQVDAVAKAKAECLTERLMCWSRAPCEAGSQLFYRGQRPESLDVCVLPDGAGVVIGALFERCADPLDESTA